MVVLINRRADSFLTFGYNTADTFSFGADREYPFFPENSNWSNSATIRHNVIPIPCIVTHHAIQVNANSLDDTCTFDVVNGGAKQGLTISVGAGITGLFITTGASAQFNVLDLIGHNSDCTTSTVGTLNCRSCTVLCRIV